MNKKPPIGIINRKYHDLIRLTNLTDAIKRYFNSMEVLPIEWIEEYNELITKYKDV